MIITQDNNLVAHFPGEVHPKQKKSPLNEPCTSSARKKILEDYLAYENIAGRRIRTKTKIKWILNLFLDYLEGAGILFSDLSLKDALAYQGYLIEKGRQDGKLYSQNTIYGYVVEVNAFYEYLKKQKLVYTNPFREIKKVMREKRLPKNILKEEQMNALLDRLSRFDSDENLVSQIGAYKLHVIAELLYATGLRIDEVARLEVRDIDLARNQVVVREGKCGFSRIAFLNEYSREVLRIYIEKMRLLIFNQHNEQRKLFGVQGNQLCAWMNHLLKQVTKEMDLPKVTCHLFRHALGFHLLRAGCNIRHIQQILGHKKIRNTEVYTKVDKEDLKRVMDSLHPRRNSCAF